MRKLLTIILLLTLTALPSMAQGKPNALTVWSKDGRETVFALADKPVVSFTETTLFIKTKGMEVSYPLKDMRKLSYDYDETVDVVDIQTDRRAVSLKGNTLVFRSLPLNSRIAVTASDGAVVLQRTITHQGSYSFSLSGMSAGVYLVSVNGLTYKVAKK